MKFFYVNILGTLAFYLFIKILESPIIEADAYRLYRRLCDQPSIRIKEGYRPNKEWVIWCDIKRRGCLSRTPIVSVSNGRVGFRLLIKHGYLIPKYRYLPTCVNVYRIKPYGQTT